MNYLFYCIITLSFLYDSDATVSSKITVAFRDVVRSMIVEKPLVSPDALFQAAVAEVDRIVIYDAGYDCCDKRDDAQFPILIEITAPDEVEMFRKNMRFPDDSIASANACLCCGWPRISWHKGDTRVALTAVQHGGGLRWSQFSTTYLAFFRIGYGDVAFTTETKAWFEDWSKTHGCMNSEQ